MFLRVLLMTYWRRSGIVTRQMSITWHNQAVEELGGEATAYWRASKYRLVLSGGREWIEAEPGATWERYSPFTNYRAPGEPGVKITGPHQDLARLRAKRTEGLYKRTEERHRDLVAFADSYGLLGVFHKHYSSPILPDGKLYVSPDAVIRRNGRLERLDPNSGGLMELEKLLRHQFANPDFYLDPAKVATPSELKLLYKRHLPAGWPADSGVEHAPEFSLWNEVTSGHGVLLALDLKSSRRVVVLPTRESPTSWLFALPPQLFGSAQEKRSMVPSLNNELLSVSPCAVVGANGRLERGYRCHSLLQAMNMMVYLDLTGGTDIKRCGSQGCANYFRAKQKSRRIYCSQRCANRASTRLSRGQEP